MAYVEANGYGVSDGRLAIPRLGRSVAQLRVPDGDASFKPGDPVTLKFEAGATFQMAVQRAGIDRGGWQLLLVGGSGGLSKTVKPKAYRGAPPALVLKDILSEVGEKAGSIDLPGTLKSWTRPQAPAWLALADLMSWFPDRAWRVLPDGTVWAGQEAWPDGPEVHPTIVRPAALSYQLVATPELQPGVVLSDLGKVGRVVQQLGRQIATEVWIEEGS